MEEANKVVANDGVEVVNVAPKTEDANAPKTSEAKIKRIKILREMAIRKQQFRYFWQSGAARKLHKRNKNRGGRVNGYIVKPVEVINTNTPTK